MKWNIWWGSSALHELARGEKLSRWDHPVVVSSETDMTAKGWILCGELSLSQLPLPSREQAIRAQLLTLKESEDALRAKFESDLALLTEARNNLLALEAPK